MLDCTVILTAYKRPHTFQTQVNAILAQTEQPKKILCWQNQTNFDHPAVSSIRCDDNWKFHGRFALGLLVDTPYVCIFDDDCIPGPRWLENCKRHREAGILGASGVSLKTNKYKPHSKYGHNGKRVDELSEVALVGHSWYLHKDHIRYLFTEDPYTWDNGEDIQLSALAAIHGGIKTFVPPHPDNTEFWGCQPQYSRLGVDKEATSVKHAKEHYMLRDALVRRYLERGWLPPALQ